MRLHHVVATTILALGVLQSAAALAAPVVELEADGTAINNTLATAQVISPAAFTPNADPNVFGTSPTASILGRGGVSDVDFFAFYTTGGLTYLDIDTAPNGNALTPHLDSVLALFNSSGTMLALSDDSAVPDPGSNIIPAFNRATDSFIGVISLVPGWYYAAVSEWTEDNPLPDVFAYNYPQAVIGAITGPTPPLTRPDGARGGLLTPNATPGDTSYYLSGLQEGTPYILNITQIPVPEPGTLGLLGAGLLGLVLRRRKSA